MLLFWELLPVAVGLLCIAAAFLPGRDPIRHPVYTEGEIVGQASQTVWQQHAKTDALAPVVRFSTPQGEITATARRFVPEWQYRFHRGERVKICYDAKQPDMFRVCGGVPLRRYLLLTAGIGTLIAYGVLWEQFF